MDNGRYVKGTENSRQVYKETNTNVNAFKRNQQVNEDRFDDMFACDTY